MDDTLLFIPPCCVDKKLPKAVSEAPRRMLTFYTHGDVTMEKFFRAIAYLMDDAPSHKESFLVMVLSMPVLLNETAVFLQLCFERGWITHLVLTTQRDMSNILFTYLEQYKEKILYANNRNVSSLTSHMVLYNNDKALTLSGPMLEKMSAKTSAYNLSFFPNTSNWVNELTWGNPVENICFPDVLFQRQRVNKDKRKVTDLLFSRFLKAEFPPYQDETNEPKSHSDHYNFGQV